MNRHDDQEHADSPVADRLPLHVASTTALQLLGNIGLVRGNLEALGRDGIVQELDRYLVFLKEGCANELEFIDYATAALGWVYRTLADQERRRVFRDYRSADRPTFRHGYAPKAEVEYFCETIEPRILVLQSGEEGEWRSRESGALKRPADNAKPVETG